MENYMLCVFPLALLIILCFRAKTAGHGKLQENFWSVTDSKNLQVVAAYGIILHHLTQLVTRYGEVYLGPITILADMGILFTSIFFFYSGYGLMRSLKEKDNYLDGFLYRRMSGILVPFLLTNILYLLPGIADHRITGLLGFLSSIFGFTLMNTNAWFIIELLLFYLVFYLAFRYIKNEKTALRVLIGFVLAVIALGFLLRHDTTALNGHWFRGEWWYNSTILFAVGLLFGKHKDAIAGFFQKIYVVALPLSIVFFAGACVLERYVRTTYGYYFESYTYMGYSEKFVTLLAQMLLCILFVVMILLITMKVRFDNFILRNAATFSLEVYLIHDLCMTTYSFEDKSPRILMFVATLVIATAAAVGLHWLDEKLLELLDGYVSGKLDEKTTVEGTERKQKIKKYMNYVFGAYGLLFAALVVCFCINLFRTTLVSSEDFSNQLKTISMAQVGDCVQFGHFDSDPVEQGDEPIDWLVVKDEDDKVLLLSKYVLAGSSYHQKHEAVAYEQSDIRKMLTEEAYYNLFSDSEQKYMAADADTGDYVFLLSAEQANELQLNGDVLRAEQTECARRWGANVDGQDKHSWWWLREDGAAINAPVVTSEGQISSGAQEVNRSSGGIRPAIWVRRIQ